MAFPHGIAGPGATSRRRVDGRAHPTLPDAVPGIERGGSLRSRPQAPERRRRSCGRGATAKPPATCGIGGAHIGMAMPCTSTPMSMCTRGTPPTPAVRGSRSAPWKPARTPWWYLDADPEQVHFGNADQVIAGREAVLREAWAAHPDRFVSGEPKPKPLPEAVWINPPTPSLTTQEIAL